MIIPSGEVSQLRPKYFIDMESYAQSKYTLCSNVTYVLKFATRMHGCRPRVIPMSPLGTADHRTVRLTGVRGLVHLVITKWCCCIRLGSTPCLLQKRPRHYSRADPHPLPSTRLHMSLTCLKTGQEMCSMTCSTL